MRSVRVGLRWPEAAEWQTCMIQGGARATVRKREQDRRARDKPDVPLVVVGAEGETGAVYGRGERCRCRWYGINPCLQAFESLNSEQEGR